MKISLSDRLSNTPTIPVTVYSSLPPFLQECTNYFTAAREKDVFLTCALTLVSGCLKTIKGRYGTETLFPNLYSLVIAPPGSGKGIGNCASYIVEPLHEQMQSNPWGKVNDAENSNGNNNNPSLFIPADCSAAAFLQKLGENGGTGILYESELDTLTNSQKQDWGNYSDKLRAAFHHEKISFSRVADGGKTVEIACPKLSICMLGTPNQVKVFLPSPENGLFSRFLFYCYAQPQKFNSRKPNYAQLSHKDIFNELGSKLVDAVNYLDKFPFEFRLTDSQWEQATLFFENKLQMLSTKFGDEAAGMVYRMGAIVFRIAMTLSALIKWEAKNEQDNIECSAPIFEASLNLADIYLEHGITMLQILPRSQAPEFVNEFEQFFLALPLIFQRKDALLIGKRIGLNETAVGRKLSSLLKAGRLKQPKHGEYEKVLPEVGDNIEKMN